MPACMPMLKSQGRRQKILLGVSKRVEAKQQANPITHFCTSFMAVFAKLVSN